MKSKLDQQTLDSIAEEFSNAIRRGENPSVDEFVSRYDDTSGDLRSLLGSIAMIEGLKQATPPAGAHNEALNIRQLDDYTIVREIGRGGMGLVFEAIHQSLGRRVALKVLANSLLDQPKHLARFRREARAAARLRHPNIVPVFGVGQSDGQHYYVMDYIRGLTLREWLQSLSGQRGRYLPTRAESISDTEGDLQIETSVFDDDAGACDDVVAPADAVADSIPINTDSAEYFRWVAQIGMTVSDALDYAHDQGILHRDIKPANLLLDHKGTVWIADFGLAKLTEQQPVTMTGDVVGTPQYMPPEAFESKYDEASETYCVGLTLYELLTLRPAIDGKNAGDTIRKAIQGVAVSPRKLNRNIPRDLETIILKSLSLAPTKRYPTAGSLRDDLQRFLDNRPIGARRTGPIERLFRWTCREPAVASLTLGIFASLVTLVIVAGVGYWKTNNALIDTQFAKNAAVHSAEVADEQRLLAQSNLQVAIRAFDQLSQRIADRSHEPDAELLGDITESTSPNVTPDDAELLQSLLAFFDELAANNSDDENLKSQTAAARKRIGDIYGRLGQHRKADQSYRAALDLYQELATQSGSPVDLIITQAQIMNDRAMLAGLQGQVREAVGLYDQAVDLLRQSEPVMKSAGGRFEYARANSLFTSIATRSGLDSVTNRDRPNRRPIGRMLGRPTQNPGPRVIEEMYASAEAVDALSSLVEEFPGDLRYEIALARAYRDRAKTATKMRMMSQADKDLQASIDRLQALYDVHPESTSIKYELAKSLSGGTPGFAQRFRLVKAQRLCDELLNTSAKEPRYLALKAYALGQMATIERARGRRELEEEILLKQAALQRELLKTAPELIQYQTTLALTVEYLADIQIAKGDRAAAIRYLTQATEVLGKLGKSPIAREKSRTLGKKLADLRRTANDR